MTRQPGEPTEIKGVTLIEVGVLTLGIVEDDIWISDKDGISFPIADARAICAAISTLAAEAGVVDPVRDVFPLAAVAMRDRAESVAKHHAEAGREKLSIHQRGSQESHDWGIVVSRSDMIGEQIRALPTGFTDAELLAAALQTLTDEQMLAELVRRNKVTKCLRDRTVRDVEILVGIGKNNSVNIQFFNADLAALARIKGDVK